ncbi:MAG: hypothetical protein JSS76_11960 [Bacteroidetes bacterium]|nr:hypothetical protein [Bacteroidota bacterium]
MSCSLSAFTYFAEVKITLHPYRLEFIFPFRIAHGVRTHTDAVFVELELDGVKAFGEATLPPYLPYTQESTIASLSQFDLSRVSWPYDTDRLLPSLGIRPSTIEAPAMAALDMALWTLEAKLKQTTVANLLGITSPDTAIRTYTIAVCDREEMKDRLAFGKEKGFTTFKLKLNGKEDERMVADFHSLTDAPFAVDANQAWTTMEQAAKLTKLLAANGCILIEQPFHRDDVMLSRQLKGITSLPIIADEACQGIHDIDRIAGSFDGINIKLQKCGGLLAAKALAEKAESRHMKLLIGCMSESSIGCDAAEALSPLCQWNDLDGRYLVREVPFRN